jgi:hypothetical protein
MNNNPHLPQHQRVTAYRNSCHQLKQDISSDSVGLAGHTLLEYLVPSTCPAAHTKISYYKVGIVLLQSVFGGNLQLSIL